MTRLSLIMAALRENGPMTSSEIAGKVGITEKAVNFHMWDARKRGAAIRICGSRKDQPNCPRLYEVSERPDVSLSKKMDNPRKRSRGRPPVESDEEYMAKRKKELAKLIVPFRDPLLFMTCGVAP